MSVAGKLECPLIDKPKIITRRQWVGVAKQVVERDINRDIIKVSGIIKFPGIHAFNSLAGIDGFKQLKADSQRKAIYPPVDHFSQEAIRLLKIIRIDQETGN